MEKTNPIIFCIVVALGFTQARGKGTNVQNPCTPEAIDVGELYHPFPSDPRRFIQCTEWGKAYVRLCPVGESWYQPYVTCVDLDQEDLRVGLEDGKDQPMRKSKTWKHYMQSQVGKSKIQNTDSNGGQNGQQQNGQSNGQQRKSWGQNGQSNGQQGKSWGQNGQSDGQQGKSWGQNGQSNGQQGKSWGQNGQSNGQQGKSWGQSGQGNGQQSKSWGQSGQGNGQQGKSWGQSGQGNGQQGKSWGQSGQGNGQQGKSWGQSGQGNGQQGKSWGQSGQGNGQQGKSWGQSGQGNGQQGKSWGQSGQGNGQQGKSWGQSGQGNGQQGKSWEQSGQGNGQQGKSWGQNGQGNGQQGKSWGQNGQSNGQQGKSWGQNGQGNGQQGKSWGQNGQGNGQQGKSWGQNGQNTGQQGKSWGENEHGMENPCGDSRVQFIAHSVNPYKYYECVDGNLVKQQCEFYHVWDQDTLSCVALDQGTAGGPDKGDTPVYANPCVGSKQKFHPYPNDPRKFIECMTWYSMQIWDCGDEAVWVQEKQVCALVYKNGGKGNGDQKDDGQATQAPKTTPTDSATASICNNATEYYHPYPNDLSKFIQCDEFGNMYIRQCGPNKLWSDVFHTCVSASAAGESGSSDNGDSKPPKTGNGIVTSGDQDVSVTIDKPVFISDLNSMCPEHQYYDHDLLSCVAMPTKLPVHNQPAMNLVMMDDYSYSSCPPRFEWDSEQGACVEIEPVPEPEMKEAIQDCEPGYSWDSKLSMCIQAVKAKTFKSIAVPKQKPHEPDYPIIDRGGLTPYGYIDEYEDIDDRDSYDNQETIEEAIPPYDGPNPCLTSYGFFFEFPGDSRFYIQCDEWRQMYVQACPTGLFWDKDITTCFDNTADNSKRKEPNNDGYESSGKPEKTAKTTDSVNGYESIHGQLEKDDPAGDLNQALNPCQHGSDKENHHPHPFDNRRFIVCSNGNPYIMICPLGTSWDSSVNNCIAQPVQESHKKTYKSVQY